MVFESRSESKFHHIDKLDPGPANVWFMDIFTTKKEDSSSSPLTASMFLLEHADVEEPAPQYDYDETGVVIKGELHIKDERGNSAKLFPGDTFFIHRGSLITFSTPKFAVAYKSAARAEMHPERAKSNL